MKPGFLRIPVGRIPGAAIALGFGGVLTAAGCGGEGTDTADRAAAVDERFPPGLPGRVDSIASTALAAGPLAGLSIAIAADGEPVFAGSWGFSDIATGERTERASIYELGAVTTVFTAVAALRLAETGRLDLERPLADAVPDLAGAEHAGRIRLRHLLDHTSGLRDYVGEAVAEWVRDRSPIERDAVIAAARLEPAFAPGESWAYSATGPYLMGDAIEAASGVGYAAFVRDSIAVPLGLRDTYLCSDRARESRRVRLHEPGPDGLTVGTLDRLAGQGADAGLCGTAEDLVRLPTALARGAVLSGAGLERMLSPVRLANGVEVDHGLGVRRGALEGRPLWGHTGGLGSYTAVLAHFPAEGLTLAVLQNTDAVGVDALTVAGDVARAMLGLAEPTLEPVDPGALSRYAGQYVEADGEYAITVNGDSLVRSRGDSNVLVPLGDGVFGWDMFPMDRFRFHEVDGVVVGVSEYYNGMFAEFHPRKTQAPPASPESRPGGGSGEGASGTPRP